MAKTPATDFASATNATINRQVVQAVLGELNSGFGTAFNGTATYKSVLSVALSSVSYHKNKGVAYGKIVIASENGSPQGNTWKSKKSYQISRNDAAALQAAAPSRFKDDFTAFLASFDAEAAKHEAVRAAAKKEEQQKLFLDAARVFAQGSGTDVVAPERASFKKKERAAKPAA